MKSHVDLVGRDSTHIHWFFGVPSWLMTIAAIGMSSLPLYGMDYHRGDVPMLGAGLAFLLGAVINAVISAQALDRTDQTYLRAEYGRMLRILCVLLAWAVLYFGFIAPAVVASLTTEPEILSLARNTYDHTLKPIAHITLAFAAWGGIQLIFVDRAVQARRRDFSQVLGGAGASSTFNSVSMRSMNLVLMAIGLGALYSWSLAPCLIAAPYLYYRFQRQLV